MSCKNHIKLNCRVFSISMKKIKQNIKAVVILWNKLNRACRKGLWLSIWGLYKSIAVHSGIARHETEQSKQDIYSGTNNGLQIMKAAPFTLLSIGINISFHIHISTFFAYKTNIGYLSPTTKTPAYTCPGLFQPHCLDYFLCLLHFFSFRHT